MNKLKMILTGSVIALGVAGISTNVSAQSAAPLCVLDPLPMSQYAKSFTESGNNVTAKFTLRGEDNCKYDMTLFAFEAPAANGQPVREQKLFSSKSGTFGKGTHTLTTTKPDCYFQYDIVTGKPITATKGMRYNDVVNAGNMTNQGRLGSNVAAHIHDAKIGGTKSCDKPEKPEQPIKEIPETPQKPQTPETPVTQTVKELPSTGAGSVLLNTVGLSATAGAAVKYLRSRKSAR